MDMQLIFIKTQNFINFKMSMQVCCVDPQPQIFPPSDVEKMKAELVKIDNFMKEVKVGKATPETFQGLEAAVEVINEIILSLDNSNDFFKIGGFNVLMPLLSCPDKEVVATTAELIADLCQNNTYCQTKALECNLLPELVKLLDSPLDSKVCSKALYAVSCLCRNNENSIKHLETTNIIPILMKILQESDEKLRAKTAFFLSYLSNYDSFREAFYKADMVGTLIKLLEKEQDSSSEHLLASLRDQVFKHVQSRVQCASKEYNLKEILLNKKNLYDSKSEFEEAKEHCDKLLALCFPEEASNAS
ncbi:hsp70-binding protein 1 [Trichonephila clavata]|uniref:Hsp70-binding protein 1 n=1 Tax=Trichonephila clavata TaxID=2740835 RepID=A0A8X6FNV2_TRICU|nr:hsp70-binding protein 1 [Trichonephila clavata]